MNENEEVNLLSTWIIEQGLYKCGNCRRTTWYTDISDRTICYNCRKIMKWYEDKDGTYKPIRYEHHTSDEPDIDFRYTY